MQDKTLDEKLEDVGSKFVQLLERKATEAKPKVDSMLLRFCKWLDRKLSEPSK